MLWLKIGNTQKLKRFHLTGALFGVHFPVFNGIFDLRLSASGGLLRIRSKILRLRP
jgi:hypothetical protein